MPPVSFGPNRAAVAPMGAGITYFPRRESRARHPAKPMAVPGEVVAFPLKAHLPPAVPERASPWARLHALLDALERRANDTARRRLETARRRAAENQAPAPPDLQKPHNLWF